jgi:hypothetical protein
VARLAIALALAGVIPTAAGAAVSAPVRHVFVIVLENKGFDETFGLRSASSYLSLTLPAEGAFLPNYYGVTHESLGNYIALVSGQGSNPATESDCQVFLPVLPGTVGADGQALGSGCVYPAAVQTVADQLSARRLTWRGYMEDMGTPCRRPAVGAADSTQSARRGDQYAARHNPFVYFDSLVSGGACARYDVPLDRLARDLQQTGTTPSFSLITPNLCHDGHDTPCVDGAPGGLRSIDGFLRQWVPRIQAAPAYRQDGLLAILFDESDGSDASACCGEPQFPNTPNNGGPNPGRGGGRTGAVLLSPFIDPGTIDSTPYNHFSVLRSVEDTFGLAHLGYAASSGLAPFGPSAFTCVAPPLRQTRGWLARGSLIKLAVIGQGVAPRATLEVKLWRPGRLALSAAPQRTGRRRRVGFRRAGIATAGPGCQIVRLRLPRGHGRLVLTASTAGGRERRRLDY